MIQPHHIDQESVRKKANAKRLGSFFIRLGHSDSLSEGAQKYVQFRQEYIPNTQFTITVYSLARAQLKMTISVHFAAKTYYIPYFLACVLLRDRYRSSRPFWTRSLNLTA